MATMSQAAAHARWTTPGAFGRHPLPRKGAGDETTGGGGGFIGNVDKTLPSPLPEEGGSGRLPLSVYTGVMIEQKQGAC